MSRKQFIKSHGASCANWTWSWSFINEDEEFIIFGAWNILTEGNTSLILSEDWQIGPTGRRQPGYPQSREHIRLIEEKGYKLKTFAMKGLYANKDESGVAQVKIEGFDKILIERTLLNIEKNWYATDNEFSDLILGEISKIRPIANQLQSQIRK
jgi:5-methylcytosine-specific restriction protein A